MKSRDDDGPVHPPVDGAVHVLVDGKVLRRDEAALDPRLLALGRCYTTARVSGGRARWCERHAARLARDARHHGLQAPSPDAVAHALRALALAEFGSGAGVVRLELGADAEGETHLIGVPRPLGEERACWTLGRAPIVHPGPADRRGAKLLGVPFIDEARRWLAGSDFDEAALFDAEDRLVEGTRTNLIVVDADGLARHPAPELGAVAGLALAVARECLPEITAAHIRSADLDAAVEIVAVNAVRGARPVTVWAGRAVGSGEVGGFARRLAAALERA